jgi:hypothetical protein
VAPKSEGCSVVFCETTVYTHEVPDAIGWHGGHSTVIECKASRADALAEPRKPWRRVSDGMGNHRYLMMPLALAKEMTSWTHKRLPDHGMLGVRGRCVHVIRAATHRELCPRASREERYILEKGFHRLMGGRRFIRATGRFEPWHKFKARLSSCDGEPVKRA